MGERKLRKFLSSTLLAAVVVASLTSLFTAVSAIGEASLYVDPSSVEDTSYTPPTMFTVNIVVANVTDLYAVEFNMSFDSGVLGYRGHFVGAQNYSPSAKWQVDDSAGFLWFNITYGSPITLNPPITLANVTFYVRALGETVLDLHSTRLINSVGAPIPHVVSDGFFLNFNPYDLNKDGKVDIIDIAIVAAAFGSYPGHPRWNPAADLNDDNKVDIKDVALIAVHFGE